MRFLTSITKLESINFETGVVTFSYISKTYYVNSENKVTQSGPDKYLTEVELLEEMCKAS